jgi:hypothetical protein
MNKNIQLSLKTAAIIALVAAAFTSIPASAAPIVGGIGSAFAGFDNGTTGANVGTLLLTDMSGLPGGLLPLSGTGVTYNGGFPTYSSPGVSVYDPISGTTVNSSGAATIAASGTIPQGVGFVSFSNTGLQPYYFSTTEFVYTTPSSLADMAGARLLWAGNPTGGRNFELRTDDSSNFLLRLGGNQAGFTYSLQANTSYAFALVVNDFTTAARAEYTTGQSYLFINGVQQVSVATPETEFDISSDIRLGAAGDVSHASGTFDDFRFVAATGGAHDPTAALLPSQFLQIVPEPSTYALLVLAVLGVGILRRPLRRAGRVG